METKNFNDEKSLRIQELYEQSINKCAKAANRLWLGIIGSLAFAALLLWTFYEPPMMWFKIVIAVIIAMMCVWTVVGTSKINARMGQAKDVNELLSINDKSKKRNKYFFIVSAFVVLVAWAVLHFDGSMESLRWHGMMGAISMLIISFLILCFSNQDCPEIREIKKLLAEK